MRRSPRRATLLLRKRDLVEVDVTGPVRRNPGVFGREEPFEKEREQADVARGHRDGDREPFVVSARLSLGERLAALARDADAPVRGGAERLLLVGRLEQHPGGDRQSLSLIHISEPTRLLS